MDCDFIIVGAGTAGIALASELSKKYKVLVFESGVDNSQEAPIAIPKFAPTLPLDYTNRYFYMLGHADQGPKYPIIEGEMLGGTSGVNGMLYMRGAPDIYNTWATIAGNDDWSAAQALQVYKKLETFAGVPGQFTPSAHGYCGPLNVRQATENLAMAHLFTSAITTVTGKGIVDPNDFSNSLGGFDYSQLTQNPDSTRESSWTAYLSDTIQKVGNDKYCTKNITIYTSARVTKLKRNECGRFNGVIVQHMGKCKEFTSNRGVILCAGIQSCSILLQNNILNSNIGKCLFNHVSVSLKGLPSAPNTLPARPPFSDDQGLYAGGAVLDYQNNGLREFQVTGSARQYDAEGKPTSYTLSSLLLRTTCLGNVSLIYPSPDRVSKVKYNPTGDSGFLPKSRYIYKIMYETLVAMGLTPSGPEPDNIADVDTYIQNSFNLVYDYTGTCLMGTSADTAVVDGKCRVFGKKGLWVGDNSVMPLAANGGTQAPAYFIGNTLANILK